VLGGLLLFARRTGPRGRRRTGGLVGALILLLLGCALAGPSAAATGLSDRDLDLLGRRIWQNECGGRREGLTSWNAGEEFPSLGIGHFIWYPRGYVGPFEESFPRLARFLAANGAAVPEWALDQPCPWLTRREFLADLNSPRLKALRDLLAGTVRLQARFIAERLEASLPKLLAAAPPEKHEHLRAQFARLSRTPAGLFALVDYVHFKGEGVKPTERYRGEGWGLLQVLLRMPGTGRDAVREFAAAAEAVLTRRVANSPPARGERRWLPGWKNRVRRY
jgi:hypothetical protein